MLDALVGIDTTSSGSNLAAVDLVESWLESIPGVRRQRIYDASGQKANLIAWAGPEVDATRDGLIVSGHLDCVPAEAHGWTSDPFVVREQSGRLFGRGVCDMKGFDAIAINAFAQVAPRATRPLVLMLSYDEEVGSHGIARMAEQLDPSVLAARGVDWRAHFWPNGDLAQRSSSVHVELSRQERRTPLFLKMGSMPLSLWRKLRSCWPPFVERSNKKAVPTPIVFRKAPFLVLTVVTIEGGSAINVVPDTARLGVGVRLLPGVDPEEVESRVRAHLATLLGENLWMMRDALSPPMPEHPNMHLRMDCKIWVLPWPHTELRLGPMVECCSRNWV